jgi:hypothetical protein
MAKVVILTVAQKVVILTVAQKIVASRADDL